MTLDIDSGLVNGQCFDSHLPCANSKPVLNLSKAVFFNLFVPGCGRRQDQRIVQLRVEDPLISHQEEKARNLCLAGYELHEQQRESFCCKPFLLCNFGLRLPIRRVNKDAFSIFVAVKCNAIFFTKSWVFEPPHIPPPPPGVSNPFCRGGGYGYFLELYNLKINNFAVTIISTLYVTD